MNYWILQHNPKLLQESFPAPRDVPPNMDYWHISRYDREISPGDIAFIWHAGANKGVYNVAEIVSVAYPPQFNDQIKRLMANDSPYWTDKSERDRLRQKPALFIKRHYPDRKKPLVALHELVKRGFSNLPVVRMPRRGIYRLEKTVGQRLHNYIRGQS